MKSIVFFLFKNKYGTLSLIWFRRFPSFLVATNAENSISFAKAFAKLTAMRSAPPASRESMI